MKTTMQAFMTRFLRSPVLCTIPIPTPEPNELLIKVAYVSLNPTDYKHAAMALPPSKVLGCDFSGTVHSLGRSVDPSSFSTGDRIAGIIHGCHYSHTGAFAEYLVADASLCYKVPEAVSLGKACTIGVGWISAMQALRQRLYHGVKEPLGKEDTLLIYSAATNTGMHTIQLARIDYPNTFIIAIASPQHHAMLREFGANAVFDYKSPSLFEDIRKLGRDIRRGLDCHSEGRSTVLAAQCMLPSDKPEEWVENDRRRLVRTLPPAMIRGTVPQNVRADEWILSYTALGKPFWFLLKYYPAVAADYQNAVTYLQRLTGLLAQGKLTVVPHRLVPGKLGAISQGFEEMRAGRVRGEKLVFEVAGEVEIQVGAER